MRYGWDGYCFTGFVAYYMYQVPLPFPYEGHIKPNVDEGYIKKVNNRVLFHPDVFDSTI